MKKKLAIKGHKTRGKEVIEILQMLGGKKTIYSGKDTLHIYSLDDYGEITTQLYRDYSLTSLTYDVYTLEEFVEKFPFKINDVVINSDYRGRGIIKEMVWDNKAWEVKYRVNFFEDFGVNAWLKCDEIKISNISLIDNTDPIHVLCENLCENKLSMLMIDSEACKDEVEIILNDYEIVTRDGKTFAVKKKSKYPKTYEECCKIMGIDSDNFITIRNRNCIDGEEIITDYEDTLINKFDALWKLLICRDAYWKIAGKEMGLGKPWEPDYNNKTEKYVVYPYQYLYSIDKEYYRNTILAFPTKEMRDAFYENFKDLIEKCKKLL